MFSYTINFSLRGIPQSLQRDDGACIPLDPRNADFRRAIEEHPELDYTTPIASTEKRTRLFRDIRADLVALTAQQKSNIWTAFTAGNPPLYQTDKGVNAGLLAIGQFLGQVASFSGAEQQEFRLRAIVLYVMDNTTWLVTPAFDNTINVPGDELVP